ncbi:MAG: homoserine dehydrogenase [Pseudomonadota bacterium]
MKQIDVAISGFGTVGKHVARLLGAREARYRERFGVAVRVTGVCGSRAGLCDAAGLSPARLDHGAGFTPGLTGAPFIDQVRADVLFEASPSDFRDGGAALGYMRTALRRRMQVIAISKGALAFDYAGLRDEARRQGVALRISGATSAALPTIDLLQYNLAGCEIVSFEAILTGTTNVILSAMMEQNWSFAQALAEAQRLGIAESNPALDIDGWDTACKLTILANAAFDAALTVDSVPREGIAQVSADDIAGWRAAGLTPRLVGCIERAGGVTRASVALRLYGADHPFARVHGRAKAIRVVCETMGELTVIGAGSDPVGTAAAALKDFEHVLAAL